MLWVGFPTLAPGNMYLTISNVKIKAKEKKKHNRVKWLSGEALQMAEKRRGAKGKGGRKKYTHLKAELQRIARRGKK